MAEVVKKLPVCMGPEVNKIYPKMLKVMDMADRPLQCCMEVWNNTCGVAENRKGNEECVPTKGGSH